MQQKKPILFLYLSLFCRYRNRTDCNRPLKFKKPHRDDNFSFEIQKKRHRNDNFT